MPSFDPLSALEKRAKTVEATCVHTHLCVRAAASDQHFREKRSIFLCFREPGLLEGPLSALNSYRRGQETQDISNGLGIVGNVAALQRLIWAAFGWRSRTGSGQSVG